MKFSTVDIRLFTCVRRNIYTHESEFCKYIVDHYFQILILVDTIFLVTKNEVTRI